MSNTACANKSGKLYSPRDLHAYQILLAGFTDDSIVDGPGLRCVIFTQGCPHHCPGCHNPTAQPFQGGNPTHLSMLYKKIKANRLCNAITFSGGEPFCQAENLIPLASVLRSEGYELAAYSGYTWEELTADPCSPMYALLCLLDTVIDGRYVAAQRDLTLRFRGSRNQRILDVQRSLAEGQPVWETGARWVG